jgi:ectoine hydroxylase-related dioxygenase (phytanoyl-CoA dioxygenase family)
MRMELRAGEIAFYRENGYMVMQDFLTPAEVERWRVAVDRAVTARGEQMLPDRTNVAGEDPQSKVSTYYDKVFTQRVNLWQSDPAIKQLIIDEGIGKLATELADVDGIRMWHDQALIKQPFANPTAYHLDGPNWSFTSADGLSIWVPLDDATVENGCMWYLPGSHKSRKLDNFFVANEIGAIFDHYPEWRGLSPVPAPVKAGGCIWHSGLIAHGAGANMTNGFRRAMTAAFMPDGSRFNGKQNVLRDEDVARLTVGDVLDLKDQNPLLYSRSKATASNA